MTVPAPVICGNADVSVIRHQSSPPLVNGAVPAFGSATGTKRMTFAPFTVFALRMNWCSEPWLRRGVPPPSASAPLPLVFVTTLKLNAELTFATFALETTTRVIWSEVVSEPARSVELSEFVALRPP